MTRSDVVWPDHTRYPNGLDDEHLLRDVLAVLYAESLKHDPGEGFRLPFVEIQRRLDVRMTNRLGHALKVLDRGVGAISRFDVQHHGKATMYVVHYDRVRVLGLAPEWAP